MAMDEVGVEEELQNEIAANFKKHIPMALKDEGDDEMEMGEEEMAEGENTAAYGDFLSAVDEEEEF